MRELQALLPRPSHYLGTEVNSVHKDAAQVKVRLALAFPDLYEVGMSYIGQKILYHLVNEYEDYWAERVFAPSLEAARLMRENAATLTTLESDTALSSMDVLAFSLTHELAYTSVLYMLDLAGIKFYSQERENEWPLLIAGGGALYNPEPSAPFFDLMVIGDGEQVLPEILQQVAKAKESQLDKIDLLQCLKDLPGVYVPLFFQESESGQNVRPIFNSYTKVEKRVLPDLDKVDFPSKQIVPFGKVIHSRYSVEIARGCTRGCRFCHAGMVYRPVRERSLENLDQLISRGLNQTGFGELSFLSLSTGDFSALDGLFAQSFSRCQEEQVSISLPSLRVGSLSPKLMALISQIRRTGATLAPEAGSQRLRDVINKGITEEELLEHTEKLFQLGWNNIKLYFMIGLPTETQKDLKSILELCKKVKEQAGAKAKQVQVTAAISPFIPKAHTPFQWESQIGLEETRERINFLKEMFRPVKGLKLRWHMPEMSFLEGVFSRGDRRLAPVVVKAYELGDILSSWTDHFSFATWQKAFQEIGIEPGNYLQKRDLEVELPWEHINSGLRKSFLKAELKRALKQEVTADCRYQGCRECGVCNFGRHKSVLEVQTHELKITPRLNQNSRDQEQTTDTSASRRVDLGQKGMHVRIWYSKKGPASFFSQLELQDIFERALRRAGLPVSFSKGFHPLPLLSFGRALPVGVSSLEEWVNVFFREELSEQDIGRIKNELPLGLDLLRVQRLSMGRKQPQAVVEDFRLRYLCAQENWEIYQQQWKSSLEKEEISWQKKGKKKWVTKNIRPMLLEAAFESAQEVIIRFSWQDDYLSPLKLVQAINQDLELPDFELLKLKQYMPQEVPPDISSLFDN
jgi:radical SAM family uncharacterized protein/radical SAM-linked protein